MTDYFIKTLATEQLAAIRELASAFILGNLDNVESKMDPKALAIYGRFNSNQQQSLNRILAKVIANTIKTDVYFAETVLGKEDKEQVANIKPEQVNAYVSSKREQLNPLPTR